MKCFLLFLSFVFLSTPDYGPEYNTERIKIGIPVIEEGWKKVFDLCRECEISQIDYAKDSSYYLEGTDVKKGFSCHNRKTIVLFNGIIQTETDQYVRYLSKEKVRSLLISYSYKENSWKVLLYDSFKFDGIVSPATPSRNNRHKAITLQQADSILVSWGLSRTGE